MKENKAPIYVTLGFMFGLTVGIFLQWESSEVKYGKSEKRRDELIQLLGNQTEMDKINNITIEELQEELELYFNDRNKALEYNNDLRR